MMEKTCTTCSKPVNWDSEANPYCSKECMDKSPVLEKCLRQLEDESELASKADTQYY